MNDFNWSIKNKSNNSNARTGIISTPHGDIETPAFVFCATKAALKSSNFFHKIIHKIYIVISKQL